MTKLIYNSTNAFLMLKKALRCAVFQNRSGYEILKIWFKAVFKFGKEVLKTNEPEIWENNKLPFNLFRNAIKEIKSTTLKLKTSDKEKKNFEHDALKE